MIKRTLFVFGMAVVFGSAGCDRNSATPEDTRTEHGRETGTNAASAPGANPNTGTATYTGASTGTASSAGGATSSIGMAGGAAGTGGSIGGTTGGGAPSRSGAATGPR